MSRRRPAHLSPLRRLGRGLAFVAMAAVLLVLGFDGLVGPDAFQAWRSRGRWPAAGWLTRWGLAMSVLVAVPVFWLVLRRLHPDD